MKAALLVESLTGNTWKAAEAIAANLQQENWQITGIDPVKHPNHAAIQEAEMVIVGTWVHGLFVVGQAPFGIGGINNLPVMRGKKAAVFCTYALNAGTTLDKMTNAVSGRGAEVLGGLTIHRGRLAEHTEEFAARLIDAIPNYGVNS